MGAFSLPFPAGGCDIRDEYMFSASSSIAPTLKSNFGLPEESLSATFLWKEWTWYSGMELEWETGTAGTVFQKPRAESEPSGPFFRKFKGATLATSSAFYRSQKGLSLKNSEKSPKRGSRAREAPGSKKPEKESKMTIFQVFFEFSALFQLFFDFFLSFFNPGAERPREPLFELFSEFSRERPVWLL